MALGGLLRIMFGAVWEVRVSVRLNTLHCGLDMGGTFVRAGRGRTGEYRDGTSLRHSSDGQYPGSIHDTVDSSPCQHLRIAIAKFGVLFVCQCRQDCRQFSTLDLFALSHHLQTPGIF